MCTYKSCRRDLFFALACACLVLLLSMSQLQSSQQALAKRIAPSLLRLHILAQSDTPKDQELKLEVRSFLLDYLSEQGLPALSDKKEATDFLSSHATQICTAVNGFLKAKNTPYQASLRLGRCFFPTRAYAGLIFPCGFYDALEIVLGSGKGHNWWCVLYPRFCFLENTCSEIPPESMAQLSETLNRDDLLALQDRRPDLEIRFHFLPFLNRQGSTPS